MADENSGIPLADVLRAANQLVSGGLIKDYALGGAHFRRERHDVERGNACNLFAFAVERVAS